jgi:hypothetical protein
MGVGGKKGDRKGEIMGVGGKDTAEVKEWVWGKGDRSGERIGVGDRRQEM